MWKTERRGGSSSKLQANHLGKLIFQLLKIWMTQVFLTWRLEADPSVLMWFILLWQMWSYLFYIEAVMTKRQDAFLWVCRRLFNRWSYINGCGQQECKSWRKALSAKWKFSFLLFCSCVIEPATVCLLHWPSLLFLVLSYLLNTCCVCFSLTIAWEI